MVGILRLEGLPFKITCEDIEEWIQEYSKLESSQIHLISNRLGRASGEAYVEFKDASDAKTVLDSCDEKNIGDSNRYVKVHETEKNELDWQLQRQDLFKGTANVFIHSQPCSFWSYKNSTEITFFGFFL